MKQERGKEKNDFHIHAVVMQKNDMYNLLIY